MSNENKHEITLKPTKTFEAFVGGRNIGIFKLESEWNGFTELKGERGQLIVSREGGMMNIMNDILGLEQPEKVNVITASPDLILDILKG
jgi:hypothetical protein